MGKINIVGNKIKIDIKKQKQGMTRCILAMCQKVIPSIGGTHKIKGEVFLGGAAGNPRVPRLLPGTLGSFPGYDASELPNKDPTSPTVDLCTCLEGQGSPELPATFFATTLLIS